MSKQTPSGWDQLISAAEPQTASSLDSEARLELDPERDMSEGLHPDTVKGWNRWVKMSPAAFCDAVLRDLPDGLKITMRISGSGNATLKIGPLPGARTRFEATRELDASNGKASHQKLEIAPGLQRQGLAAISIRNLLPLYRQMGITRLKVQAQGDNAACCWARYGFVPEQDSWKQLQQSLLEKATGDAALTKQIKALTAETLPDFADQPQAEAALQGLSFDGWLNLDDAEAAKRLTTRIEAAEQRRNAAPSSPAP